MYAPATVSEIAACLGVSARAVQARAKKDRWPVHAREGRSRQAFYRITDLPTDVQAALSQAVTRKITLRAELAERAGQAAREESLARFVSLSNKEQARVDARIEVLRSLKAFAEAKGIGGAPARRAFAVAYNAGPKFLYRTRWYRQTRRYVKKVILFYQSRVTDIRRLPAQERFLPAFSLINASTGVYN